MLTAGAWCQRLKPRMINRLSDFAFNFNLHRYIMIAPNPFAQGRAA